MLGEVVSAIGGSWGPVDMELTLLDSILDPIESHVYGLGSDLFTGVVSYATYRGVVDLYWGGRLGVSQFYQAGAEHNCFRAIDKQ